MKKLLAKLKKLIADWRNVAKLAGELKELRQAKQQAEYHIAQLEECERELRLMQMEPNRAAELIMQLRVHAMFEHGEKGYGVTAFIPETVLERLRHSPEALTKQFTETIADNLVYRAVKGLWYRTSMNNVSALVFDWRPAHRGEVNAVCMEGADHAPRIAAREPVTKKIAAITLKPETKQIEPPSDLWK